MTMEKNAAMTLLSIEDLRVAVDGKEILKGINLSVGTGEVHAIMGPNGSGKSTLSHVLAGRDGYEVTQGQVLYKGEDLLAMEPEERPRRESSSRSSIRWRSRACRPSAFSSTP